MELSLPSGGKNREDSGGGVEVISKMFATRDAFPLEWNHKIISLFD